MTNPRPPIFHRVVFLDIDGVLLSHRSCLALGGWPNDLSPGDVAQFDPVALALLRSFCAAAGAGVVLSSTWRINHTWSEVGVALDLPLIGATPRLLGPRGAEIACWLGGHPEVESYAILDDDSDMLSDQLHRFIRVPGDNGFTWPEFVGLCALFDINHFDCFMARPRPLSAPALSWVD